jgi:DNA-cytosine methyltransferase
VIGSLFSGIGGLELGLEWVGLGPVVFQVEKDAFCRQVLAKHWPDANRSVIDVKCAGSATLPPVPIICGGFPCQDVSGAGKGAGLDGTRSGLWWEYRRIVDELRPAVVVIENVASGAKRWLCPVRRSLHELGYRTRALGVSAADVGAPHLRKRIFVVAYADGNAIRIEQRRRSGPNWPDSSLIECRGETTRVGLDRPFDGPQKQAERQLRTGHCECWDSECWHHKYSMPVADSDRQRRVEPKWHEQELRRRPADGRTVEYADMQRRERATERRERSGRGAVVCASSRGHGWTAQSELGRGAARVPNRLDRCGLQAGQEKDTARQDPDRAGINHLWPAGRGEAQYVWEPPRTVAGRPANRRARVKALGNAVVPQCAYVIGLEVRRILEAQDQRGDA